MDLKLDLLQDSAIGQLAVCRGFVLFWVFLQSFPFLERNSMVLMKVFPLS